MNATGSMQDARFLAYAGKEVTCPACGQIFRITEEHFALIDRSFFSIPECLVGPGGIVSFSDTMDCPGKCGGKIPLYCWDPQAYSFSFPAGSLVSGDVVSNKALLIYAVLMILATTVVIIITEFIF